MTKKIQFLFIISLLIVASLVISIFQYQIPITGSPNFLNQINFKYIQEAPAAKGSQVSMVSVAGKFSYPVVQSGNNPPSGNVIGQYAYAASKGNIGLLPHNYAAGSSFYVLNKGDEVIITFDNGSTKRFVVNNLLRFQATDPNDYSKPFIDGNGNTLSTRQVFNRAYKSNGVTFQTCIENNGSTTWGLLFVQAVPKN